MDEKHNMGNGLQMIFIQSRGRMTRTRVTELKRLSDSTVYELSIPWYGKKRITVKDSDIIKREYDKDLNEYLYITI